MMSGDDGACINADELRWRVLCLCRQINPVGPIISHLRQFPGGLCPETQSWCVNKCIDESLTAHFPRSLDFERKLLRAVVLAVESDGHELTEDLMSAFSKRLITDTERNNNSCSQWSYKLYTYTSDARTLVDTHRKIEQNILENAAAAAAVAVTSPPLPSTTTQGDDRSGLLALHVSNDMLAGETGCWDWEAGFFLSEFIFNHPDLFRGKNILELGSGCGMAGVALARVAAASVLCTDGDVEALDNCLQNLRINGLHVVAAAAEGDLSSSEGATEIPKIRVQRLRWENDAAPLFNTSSSIDIVVGADLTYDPVNIPPLIKILKEILLFEANNDNNSKNDKGVVVYIATTRRSEATFQTFLDALDAEPELQVEDVSSIATLAGSNCIKFCHVESLEAARGRIVLHRITACRNLV